MEKKEKVNCKAERDPNSNRSLKRKNRNFTGSRAERRNTKRQGVAMGAWATGCSADVKGGGKGFRKPGANHPR
jgi:hypothetical protein